MSLFKRKEAFNPENSTGSLQIKEFVESRYLTEQYLVPPFIEEALSDAAIALQAIPGFVGIVNVGGTANGSYELRKLSSPKPATDLDFYLIGHSEMRKYLSIASETVRDSIKNTGLEPDGVLNGRNPTYFLDLDNLEDITAEGDVNLLALPFQSFFGDSTGAKETVLQYLVARNDKQELWDEIASYHIQSLSLHHGSFDPSLSDEILNTYYPDKIARFELPATPEEALSELQK